MAQKVNHFRIFIKSYWKTADEARFSHRIWVS